MTGQPRTSDCNLEYLTLCLFIGLSISYGTNMKTFLLISLALLSGCAGPLSVKTVTTSDGIVTTTKIPAKIQAWSDSQKSLRDLQIKVLDLLIAKETPEVSTTIEHPVHVVPAIKSKEYTEDLVIRMGEDADGEVLEYTLTSDDMRKINAAVGSDDSAKAPISAQYSSVVSISAMKDLSLALIKSTRSIDPTLARLLGNPGTPMPTPDFVDNAKALGGLISPYASSFFSGLFSYLIVDSAMDVKENQLIKEDYYSFDYKFDETKVSPLE